MFFSSIPGSSVLVAPFALRACLEVGCAAANCWAEAGLEPGFQVPPANAHYSGASTTFMSGTFMLVAHLRLTMRAAIGRAAANLEDLKRRPATRAMAALLTLGQ